MAGALDGQTLLAHLDAARVETGPDWLRAIRKDGKARFENLGLPGPKEEAWRNTNLSAIVGTSFHGVDTAPVTIDPDTLPAVARLALGGPRLVFGGCRFDEKLSSVEGLAKRIWIGSLSRAMQEIPDRLQEHLARIDEGASAAFHALNGALLDDGAVVIVPDDLTVEAPIEIVYASGASEPTATHPRTLIVVGRNSRCTVVETYVGTGGESYFTNAVSEVLVGDNAHVDHLRIQHEDESAYHIGTAWSRQGRDSRYTAFNIDLGAKLARHDTRAVLNGDGGNINLYGLYLTSGEQHVDNHTILDHARPHCDSRELYKGILAGRSRTIFSGRIIVRQEAQKTDAKQSNPNLLLSNEALAHTRPQLEIYADDVKCTHGATIGRMSDDAIFYLRSRGIGKAEAKQLLIRAYAGEVLEQVPVVPVREVLEAEINGRLQQLQASEHA